MGEVEGHSGRESGFTDAEEEAEDEEAGKRGREGLQGGDDSPGEYTEGNIDMWGKKMVPMSCERRA